MITTKHLANRNTSHIQLLLFLFTTAFFPVGVRGQAPPPNLPGFECFFSNPDGPNVYPCASEVTAIIDFSAGSLSTIRLGFPNTFQITQIQNANPTVALVNPLPSGSIPIGGSTIPSGMLWYQDFTPTSGSTHLEITFSYRNCVTYNSTQTANINALYFYCAGWSSIGTQYLANLIHPGPGLPEAVSGYLVQANYPVGPTASAIELVTTSPPTFNQSFTSVVTGTPGYRYFTVQINSSTIKEFDLHIGQEDDVTEGDFQFCQPNLTTVSPVLTNSNGSSTGFGIYHITLPNFSSSNPYPNEIPSNGYLTGPPGGPWTISFRQKVTLICSENTSSDVFVSLDCANCFPGPQSNHIALQWQVIGITNISATSCTLVNTSSSATTDACAGFYDYTLGFSYNDINPNIYPPSAQRPSRLHKIVIPINTNSFNVLGISIGDGASFSPPIYLNSNVFLTPTGSGNQLLTINVDNGSSFIYNPVSPNWPGFVSNFNGVPGAWINTTPSPPNLMVRIMLQSIAPDLSDCPNGIARLTPTSNSLIQFNMYNTCEDLGNDVANPYTVAAPAAQATPQASLSVVANGTNSVAVTCNISIPTQSPFIINATNPASGSVSVNQIDCQTSDLKYFAVLSVPNPPTCPTCTTFTNIGNISGLTMTINNVAYSGTISTTSGGLTATFELPDNIGPQLYNNYIVNFNLTGIDCPDPYVAPGPPTGGSGQGTLEFKLAIQAICDCGPNSVVKNIACSPLSSCLIHCAGPCTSVVDTYDEDLPGQGLFTIQRTSFGWVDQFAYDANTIGNPTYLDEAGFNNLVTSPSDREQQRRKLYPYDEFEIDAYGKIEPLTGHLHNTLSFEINYPTSIALGPDFFDLISYDATFTSIDDPTNFSYTISGTPTSGFPCSWNQNANLTPAGWPIAFAQYTHLITWDAAALTNALIYINNNDPLSNNFASGWKIHLKANFRVTATNGPSPYNYDYNLLCQFRSEATDGPHRTCDMRIDPLKVLIPIVELDESTSQTGDISLPALPPNSVVGNVNSNPALLCNYGHAIGIKHKGGNGNIPDFFPEYRPLTKWPTQITDNSIDAVDDFLPSPLSYTGPSPTFVNGGDPLLPTLIRGEIGNNNEQGLVLTLKKDCPVAAQVNLSNSLAPGINRYAYVHNGFGITLPAPQKYINPSSTNVTPAAVLAGLNCSDPAFQIFGTQTNSLSNGTSLNPAIYDFDLSLPTLVQGSMVSLEIIVTSPGNVVTLAPLQFGASYGSTFVQTSPNLYYFDGSSNAMISGVIPARLPIILGTDGCFDDPFTITFRWSVYCTGNQITNSSTPCWTPCDVIGTFQRSGTVLDNTLIDNEFTLSASGCELVWTVTLTNPATQPDIIADLLRLNFTTGLIYQSGFWEVSNSGLGQQSFTGTYPASASPAPNFVLLTTGSPTLSTVQSNFLIYPPPGIPFLPSGETLTYTLTFSLSQDFCDGGYSPGSMIITNARFITLNTCTEVDGWVPINVDNSSATNAIQTIATTGSCCIAPTIVVKHACGPGATDGEIEIINPFAPGTNGIAKLFNLGCTTAPCSSTNINLGTGTSFTLNSGNVGFGIGVGTYHLFIFNPSNGGVFEYEIVIEDYSFWSYAPISPDPAAMCSGGSVTLQPNANMVNYTGGTINYTYDWFLNGVIQTQPAPNNTTPEYIATTGGVYEVTVSNGSCSVSSSITVLVDPPLSISGDNAACGTSSYYTLPAYFNNLYGNLVSWTLNGTVIANGTGDVTIDWSAYNYFGGTLVANTPVVCGSTGTIIFDIGPCCTGSLPVITENSLSNFNGSTQVNFSSGGGNYTISNQTFVLDNANLSLICNSNLILNNCNIAMKESNQFFVGAGYDITLFNTNIKACDYRHRGINADQGGGSIVNITGGQIEGAEIGVRVKGGDLIFDHANFDKNLHHVYAQNSRVVIDGGEYKCTGNIVPLNSTPAPPQSTIYSIYLKNCTTNVPEINNANFYDAMYGINTYRSGLICSNNYFQNCVKGINVWNSSSMSNQEANIGWASHENRFNNCSEAISVGGNLAPCKIDYNKITDASNFGIKLQLLRGRYFSISGNHICNAKIAIYSYLNASSLPGQGTQNAKQINRNWINWDCEIHTFDNFPAKGIIVEEATPAAGVATSQVHLEINDNGIWECRHGIDVTNLRIAEIDRNRIYVHPDLTGTGLPVSYTDYANGIGVTASNDVKVTNNLVSSEASLNPSYYDWAISGIRIAASPNTLVCNNSTEPYNALHPYKNTPLQIGDPFEFHGVCFPSVFKKNGIFNYTSRGLYMGGMDIDLNAGVNGVIIGRQYDLNFNFNPPMSITVNSRDNQWDDMFPINGAFHTDFNNVSGDLNKFFMTYPTDDITQPPVFQNNSQAAGFFANNPLYTFQSAVLTSPTLDCGYTRMVDLNKDAYDDIALDSIIKLGGNDTSRYFSKEFLYAQMKQNDSLNNVTSLAQFKAAADNTNLNPINSIKQGLIFPIDSTGLDSLNNLVIGISPDNNVEDYHKEVFELAIKNPELKDSIYTSADMERLHFIARLCPYVDGGAVYTARVLLHAFEPHNNYYNYCEFAKRPNRTSSDRHSNVEQNQAIDNPVSDANLNMSYKVIPNPNNGTFSLLCPDNSNISLTIYDNKGTKVYDHFIKPSQSVLNIDLGNTSKGLYNLVITTEKTRQNIKFAIIN